ncbi:MAG TPA: TetR/AcrR family transcriptional regulator [Pseudonocardiaceae bacterium]
MRDKAGTKARILAIAAELFAAQGYTGTSIADIAHRLGTTPAALYYHFASKADVLDGLLAEPMAGYTKLAEQAATATPEELLAAFIDFYARSHALTPIVGADPAVRALLDERLPRKPADMFADVIAALAGPNPDRAALLRAHAAFAVVKEATAAALRLGDGELGERGAGTRGPDDGELGGRGPGEHRPGDGVLGDADRAEILAIATRTLRS